MRDALTLDILWTAAIEWCPFRARWEHLLERPISWGPAHELGHALIEPADRRDLENYGACSLGFCGCEDDRCDVHEIAAMTISSRLLTYVGRPDLVLREIEDTTDYDLLDIPFYRGRARALLRELGLWPVPYTVRRLEAALTRAGLVRMGSLRGPPRISGDAR